MTMCMVNRTVAASMCWACVCVCVLGVSHQRADEGRLAHRQRENIKNHKDWYAHQELVKARDEHVKNNPSLGDSAVNNREASRFVSASTPFAGKALDVRVDGTYATALSSDALQDELQRKLGLWLSVALPTLLRVALERGMPGGGDF